MPIACGEPRAKSGLAGTLEGGRVPLFVDTNAEKHVAGQKEKEDPGPAPSKRLTQILGRAKL